MTTAEFMKLITILRELDHHKRNLVKAALNQQTDAIKILEPPFRTTILNIVYFLNT